MELGAVKYASLAIGIAGLLLLGFCSGEENQEISKIGKESIGKKVNLSGVIRNLEIRKGNAFFELENQGRLQAVYFGPKREQLLILQNGTKISVQGTISLYKNKLQIIARSVGKID